MTPQEILIRARALIETPERWTKGTSARKWKRRVPCDPVDPKAHCWCSSGAIWAVAQWETYRRDAHELLLHAIDHRPIIDWNDAPERTHAEVLAAFDRAIEMAARDAG